MKPLPPQGTTARPAVLTLHDPSGRCRLAPCMGTDIARHHFCVSRQVHRADELGLHTVHEVLLLGNDHTGAAELCDFELDEGLDAAQRTATVGRLVQQARERLRADGLAGGTTLVVELPGWRDAQGQSPFWEGLGRHFHAACAEQQRAQWGPHWTAHLAAVLPRQCIFVSMLAPAAQAALGRPADDQVGLAQALQAAGFLPFRHVRIDDGGPVLTAAI